MTAATRTAELLSVADEGLFRTNPVWSVDRLLDRWEQKDASWAEIPRRLPRLLEGLLRREIYLPQAAVERWARRYGFAVAGGLGSDQPRPGVVGLSVDVSCRETFVVPLVARRADEWGADPTLPFRPATLIQDLLLRLLDAHHLPHAFVVPERFAFHLRDLLGRRADGPSMSVAGLLAVLYELNGRPAALSRCCAVVQPDGDRLVTCGGIEQKLDAFVRECGAGTLLVRTPESAVAGGYDGHFEVVWQVTSLSDLARLTASLGWLDPFLTSEPLSAADAAAATAQAERLEQVKHHYGDALDLLNRITKCGFRPDVTARVQDACRQSVIDLYRHLGAYERTTELSAEAKRATDASALACYDEQARADVTYAASLFAPHRFADIRQLLAPWREVLVADPRRVSARTRVMVFNTLARALSAEGELGWELLFGESEALLRQVDPADLARTWSYLAHAFLKRGRTSDAAVVLDRVEQHPGLGDVSGWFMKFLQAEGARQSGQLWSDPEMERAAPSARVGHPFGLYLQATARQPGRSDGDAIARFRAARQFFEQDRPDGDRRNIQVFLADCLLLAEAAWADDVPLWCRAQTAVSRHVSEAGPHSLAEFYSGFVPSAESGPDKSLATRLLVRVPFF